MVDEKAFEKKKDLNGVMCSKHKYKPAKAFCAVCGKPFCEADLAKIGNEYVCYDCLRAMIKKHGREPTVEFKSLTPILIIGAFVFILMAIYFVFLHIDYAPKLMEDLKSPEARIYMRDVIIALLFFIEAILILLTNKTAFALGIFLSLWMLFGFLAAPSAVELPEITTEYIILRVILPVLALITLLIGKRNLYK
ncbi:hypothetical protein J7J26_03110 [Candidatus Micrarchaeota archaeon]|nr:hypothetical protein [Candidatus Micrarchaeota archaeon]